MSKKVISIIVSLLIVVVNIAGAMSIEVLAEPLGWSATKGKPTLSESAEEGYVDFRVTPSDTAATDEKYDMLKNSIVLSNLSLPDGYWGYLGIKNDARSSSSFLGNPQAGSFGFLLRNSGDKLRISVRTKNAQDNVLCTIPKTDEYVFTFGKSADGKGYLKINGTTYTASGLATEINNYCNSGLTEGYVSLMAQNWMKGSVRVANVEIELPWDSVTGNIKVSQSIDGEYTDFRVTPLGPAATTKTYDILNTALVIKNTTIPKNRWGMLVYKTVRSSSNYTVNSEGGLSILLRNKGDAGIQCSVFVNNAEVTVANLSVEDIYTIRFVKKATGKYALQINEKTFDSSYVNSYCQSGLTEGYFHLFAEDYWEGSVKICKLPLEQTGGEDVNSPVVYYDDEENVCVTQEVGALLSSSEKLDLLKKAIKISDCALRSKRKLTLWFNKNGVSNGDELNDTANGILGVSLYKNEEGLIEVLSEDEQKTKLGTVPYAEDFVIALIKQEDNWGLRINETFISDSSFNEFVDETETKAFLSISTDRKISYKYKVTDAYWKLSAKTGTAEVAGKADGSIDASLSGDGFIVSTEKYNPFYTDAVITNLNLDEGQKLLCSLNRTKVKKINNTTDQTQIMWYVKAKADSEFEVGIVDSSGVETVIKTLTSPEEIRLSFAVDQNEKTVPVINGENCDISDEAYQDISDGIGGFFAVEAVPMSYFTLSAVNDAAFTFNTVIREKPVEEITGWNYYSSSGLGSLPGNETDGYSQDNLGGAMYAFSNKTYDPTKTSVKVMVDEMKEWFYFSISNTDMSDLKVIPSGTDVKRIVFVITPQNKNEMARFSYWNKDGKAVESPINVLEFDWTAEHTYNVKLGSDNHWHLVVDSVIMQGITSDVLDSFMEEYAEDGIHYGVGSYGGIKSHGIRVVEQEDCDNTINTEAWSYISSYGGGTMNGSDKDGYSTYLASGDLYAVSSKSYNVNETAVQFKITDVRDWIWFSVSATDLSDKTVLPTKSASETSRVVFIITPKLSAIQAQFSIFHDEHENVLKTVNFDWYGSNHTLDVRKSSNGHWFLAIDGKLIQNQISAYLDTFMELHADEEVYYGLGGMGCFGAENIKVVEKPAEQSWTSYEEGGSMSDEMTLDPDLELDFGFDYSDEDGMYELDDADWGNEFEDGYGEDYDITSASKRYQKIWKRRLVEKGHGIIFNTFEWIAMISGGVAVLAGLTVLTVFLIKKKKKSKK